MSSTSTGSFEKISPTALLVTYARQFSDIPYAREICQLVNAQAVFEAFVPAEQEAPVYAAVLIEGRYKAISRVLAQFQITQILELASGLLPRGIIMTEDPNITYIESDLPAMLARKQELVKHIISDSTLRDRQNLHFQVIDATHQPSQFLVAANYLRDDQPVAILCEGLLGYLTFEEKARVFANVREVLQRYGGVWITSDFVIRERRQQVLKNNPAMQQLMQSLSNNTGRSIEDNNFDTVEQAKQFAASQGFQTQEYSLLEMLNELACLERLHMDLDFAKQFLASTSVYALTLEAN